MVRKSDLTRRAGAIWDALAQGDPEALADAQDSYANPTSSVRRARNQPERDEVQRPLVLALRRRLLAGSVVFAVPNLARSREQAFALIRDGMLPGVPDIVVLTFAKKSHHQIGEHSSAQRPWLGFIECKSPYGGTLSDAQREVQALITALGYPLLSECRSVQQAFDWLQEEEVLMR